MVRKLHVFSRIRCIWDGYIDQESDVDTQFNYYNWWLLVKFCLEKGPVAIFLLDPKRTMYTLSAVILEVAKILPDPLLRASPSVVGNIHSMGLKCGSIM